MTERPPDPTDRLELVVVGLGYVGLPLLVAAARAGLACAGLDRSDPVVAGLSAGSSHVDDVSSDDVDQLVESEVAFTTDPACLGRAEVVVICVPTPLSEDGSPDLSAVLAAGADVAAHLRPGMLVVLESTTYPGTTDGVLRDVLETSGLRAGDDFHLAFSPERIDPGNKIHTLTNTPKVVGGLTPACRDSASNFYSKFIDTIVPVSGTREAEMAKLLENTFRHVNIALVNEMAVFSHELGVDLWESIDAAATKPFGFMPFYPGPGVGGHCIPIDPNYLSYRVRRLGYQFRFVELAQEISNRMPSYVVGRIQTMLNDRGLAVSASRVLLVGLTYKADIADDRETPARHVVRNLRALDADLVAHDPHLDRFEVDGESVVMVDLDDEEVDRADVVVLLQAHSSVRLDWLVDRASALFDTRGVVTGPNVVRL